MNLHQSQSIVEKKKRRLGQGHGSGRVKTSGRGTKGKNARGKVSLTFEGGALPLIKRLPFRRGKSRNDSFQEKPIVLDITALNTLPKNTVVTVENLVKYKLVTEKEAAKKGVKILGSGALEQALTVKVPVSKSVAKQIEKMGGTIESVA